MRQTSVCAHYVNTYSVIQLQDDMVGSLPRSKLHVHNTVHTQLLNLLKAPSLQMFPHLFIKHSMLVALLKELNCLLSP